VKVEFCFDNVMGLKLHTRRVSMRNQRRSRCEVKWV